MIYGVGTDILRIERGEALWTRFGKHAVDKLLMDPERQELEERGNPGRYLARAIVAKEAFVKALGTGFRGIGFKEVGAVRSGNDRPQLIYAPVMSARMRDLGIAHGHVSFSDEGGMVIAVVVLERG